MGATSPVFDFALDRLGRAHRFTSGHYHRMAGVGVLMEGDPVELLEGYIVWKMDHTDAWRRPTAFPQWSLLRTFTVAEYHALIGAGILTPADAVELLEGYVVNKMSHNAPHGGAITRLTVRMLRNIPVGWTIRVQLPVTLSSSEPEPDLAVVCGDETSFDGRHALPTDFGIVIEVADTSLASDRTDKGRIYARENIPVCWVVNLVDRQIEVYTNPQPAANPPEYGTRTDYPHGGTVPVVLDGVTVVTLAVADLIP